MENSFNNKETSGGQEGISLGSLLKKSREERHIDLDKAASSTRIRRHYLEALENEQWDQLPPQVFVKGFLKSYADFLELDRDMVLNYYVGTVPFQETKPEALSEIAQESSKLPLYIMVAVLVLGLIVAIIYFKKHDISFFEKTFRHMETQSLPGKGKDVLEGEPSFSKDKETVDKEREDLSGSQSSEVTRVSEGSSEPKDEKPLLPPQFTLTAKVIGRTWIALYIDDNPVREYLLQPGQAMKWTAYKGFDILIGNAGGIEFFLNGKTVGSPGTEGKVVRLRIPEGYKK